MGTLCILCVPRVAAGVTEMPRTVTPIAQRFWALVDKTETCWLWVGNIGSHGYGQISHQGGRVQTTHRLSWEIHCGAIPEGLCVLHTCDVKRCVNPAHMYLGTHSENNYDTYARTARRRVSMPGESNKSHVLTEAEVALIRDSADRSSRKLAAEFKVSRVTIDRIKRGLAWRHSHNPRP